MANSEIEELAKALVQHVRDATIRNCDGRLRTDARDPVAKRWKELAIDGNLEPVAHMLIPDIVDSTIAQLLRVIDQELLRLSFTALNARTVDLSVDGLGELCGSYMGSDGWRSRYSQERLVDDFSDLK